MREIVDDTIMSNDLENSITTKLNYNNLKVNNKERVPYKESKS